MHPRAPMCRIIRRMSSPAHRPRVLVVEDDAAFAASLLELARAQGWDAECEPDGLVALRRLFREPRPDLLLLDIGLPGIDGWGIYGEMMGGDRLTRIPVIFISVSVRALKGPLEGVIDYLQKPTNASTQRSMEATLRDHLQSLATRLAR